MSSSVARGFLNVLATAALVVATLSWSLPIYVQRTFFYALALAICLLVVAAVHFRLARWTVVVLGTALCITLIACYAKTSSAYFTGDPSNYGAFNGVCGRAQHVVAGSSGDVAVLREVECTGAPIVPGSRDYFVFVHRGNESHNNLSNLVLGYREWGSDADWRTAPTVAWIGVSSLQIRMGSPSIIMSQRSAIGDVSIQYRVGGRNVSDEYTLVPCKDRAPWCSY